MTLQAAICRDHAGRSACQPCKHVSSKSCPAVSKYASQLAVANASIMHAGSEQEIDDTEDQPPPKRPRITRGDMVQVDGRDAAAEAGLLLEIGICSAERDGEGVLEVGGPAGCKCMIDDFLQSRNVCMPALL